MNQRPTPDYQEGYTRVLWSHSDLAANLGIPRGQLYRDVPSGELLQPDVWIAPGSSGYDPERCIEFGKAIGRLGRNGRPLRRPKTDWAARAAAVAPDFAVTTDVYLSSWYCSYLYGLQKSTVYFIRQRGGFICADVLIGKNKYGWAEPRVIEIGEQTGRLDDEKIDAWVVRRTAEFGLSPRTDWVERRVASRPDLKNTLDTAIASQEP